jgi:hypothetical protein
LGAISFCILARSYSFRQQTAIYENVKTTNHIKKMKLKLNSLTAFAHGRAMRASALVSLLLSGILSMPTLGDTYSPEPGKWPARPCRKRVIGKNTSERSCFNIRQREIRNQRRRESRVGGHHAQRQGGARYDEEPHCRAWW